MWLDVFNLNQFTSRPLQPSSPPPAPPSSASSASSAPSCAYSSLPLASWQNVWFSQLSPLLGQWPGSQSISADLTCLKMCEDCQEKWAGYGLQVDRKRRWCGTCAKWHRGVYLPKRKMCENCQEKQPSALWPEGLGQHFSEIRPRHARPEMGMRMDANTCSSCLYRHPWHQSAKE
eukprot:COSAG04_NODE_2112_length_4765_cov_32.368838_3_plen_175_part_00